MAAAATRWSWAIGPGRSMPRSPATKPIPSSIWDILAHPSDSGPGKSRGYGAELRTDAALVARAAQGLMLSTYARHAASGGVLDRDELA